LRAGALSGAPEDGFRDGAGEGGSPSAPLRAGMAAALQGALRLARRLVPAVRFAAGCLMEAHSPGDAAHRKPTWKLLESGGPGK
jgi:hypothetical protein